MRRKKTLILAIGTMLALPGAEASNAPDNPFGYKDSKIGHLRLADTATPQGQAGGGKSVIERHEMMLYFNVPK